MKTTHHGDHLVRLSRLGVVNAYFVREDDGLTLVDTTMGGGSKAILAAADALGAPIRRIALTHAHADHVGSVDALAATLPDVEVLISSRDERLLSGDKSLDPSEPQDKVRGSFIKVGTLPTRTFAPGERVGSLEVVAAPGHTPGQVAFLDTRDRTLIGADTFTTLGGVNTTAVVPLRFPLAGMATWHKPTALQTARELRALNPSRLAVGHGPVVEQPAADMDAAIARAAK